MDSLLQDFGLELYTSNFKNTGFDTPFKISTMSPADCDNLKMKLIHKKKLSKMLTFLSENPPKPDASEAEEDDDASVGSAYSSSASSYASSSSSSSASSRASTLSLHSSHVMAEESPPPPPPPPRASSPRARTVPVKSIEEEQSEESSSESSSEYSSSAASSFSSEYSHRGPPKQAAPKQAAAAKAAAKAAKAPRAASPPPPPRVTPRGDRHRVSALLAAAEARHSLVVSAISVKTKELEATKAEALRCVALLEETRKTNAETEALLRAKLLKVAVSLEANLTQSKHLASKAEQLRNQVADLEEQDEDLEDQLAIDKESLDTKSQDIADLIQKNDRIKAEKEALAELMEATQRKLVEKKRRHDVAKRQERVCKASHEKKPPNKYSDVRYTMYK